MSEKMYQIGAVIAGEGVVSNLEFHRDGRFLVMTSSEGSLHLIDSLSGVEKKKIYAKTHGIGKIKYTHHESCVIMSSDTKCYDLKYLCMYDNRFIRYFKGHTDKTTSISMSPVDDYFLSSSLDKTICLWNLACPNPLAKLELPPYCERPYVAFDESGLIFGVLAQNERTKEHNIRLYDKRKIENGPFDNIAPNLEKIENALNKIRSLNKTQVQRALQVQWNSFEFSPEGYHILVNTQSDLLLILDGFVANEPVIICNRKNDTASNLGACFSSDSNFIVTGNEDNDVLLYGKSDGELKATLTGHVQPVTSVRCNPKYDVIASGCVNTALWIQPSDKI